MLQIYVTMATKLSHCLELTCKPHFQIKIYIYKEKKKIVHVNNLFKL